MKQRKLILPKNLSLNINKNTNCLYIKGPFGELNLYLPKGIYLSWTSGRLFYESTEKAGPWEASIYDLLKKMIKGVHRGFTQHLNLIGVGYRSVDCINNKLRLNLGRSIPDEIFLSTRIKVICPKPTILLLKSCDFQALSQTSSQIKSFRPPEAYKKKGIFFKNEAYQLKSGKTFK
jgi:large subunit ribosomal protein L6